MENFVHSHALMFDSAKSNFKTYKWNLVDLLIQIGHLETYS